MQSGVNIDCRYYVSVKELMAINELPRPAKKNVIINHGEVLPIITLTMEA